MDQNALVSSGHSLIRAMDTARFGPRLAMWVHDTDEDLWKLWLVPPEGHEDKADFYRRLATIIHDDEAELGGLSISDTKMIPDSHPAMQGLGKYIRTPDLDSVRFPGNNFDGYFLPEGIVLRSNL
jgi:hypothetical protein